MPDDNVDDDNYENFVNDCAAMLEEASIDSDVRDMDMGYEFDDEDGKGIRLPK